MLTLMQTYFCRSLLMLSFDLSSKICSIKNNVKISDAVRITLMIVSNCAVWPKQSIFQEHVCVCVSPFYALDLTLWLLFYRVSVQKSKWDSSRSMRYNQDAQREEGKEALDRKSTLFTRDIIVPFNHTLLFHVELTSGSVLLFLWTRPASHGGDHRPPD